MALRITASTAGGTAEIRVEGRLEAAGVADLRAKCRSAGSPLRLNLAGLQSADEVGIDALRLLRREGAEICDASPYMRHLLNAETP